LRLLRGRMVTRRYQRGHWRAKGPIGSSPSESNDRSPALKKPSAIKKMRSAYSRRNGALGCQSLNVS
jgi:hypothetical protein